ncbi:unnamed protein product [Leptidea sinapis]|uniref:Uncharacterized protein n=1 Tax=Leptidea sinapis TaxID=189913 RepID=A0A5E4QPK4_9NEOP|nr:unnamed protein product [Leptidea sinapis]
MDNEHFNNLGLHYGDVDKVKKEKDWGHMSPDCFNIAVQIKKEFGEEMEYGENNLRGSISKIGCSSDWQMKLKDHEVQSNDNVISYNQLSSKQLRVNLGRGVWLAIRGSLEETKRRKGRFFREGRKLRWNNAGKKIESAHGSPSGTSILGTSPS